MIALIMADVKPQGLGRGVNECPLLGDKADGRTPRTLDPGFRRTDEGP